MACLPLIAKKQRRRRKSRAGAARLYTLDFLRHLCYGVLGAMPLARGICATNAMLAKPLTIAFFALYSLKCVLNHPQICTAEYYPKTALKRCADTVKTLLYQCFSACVIRYTIHMNGAIPTARPWPLRRCPMCGRCWNTPSPRSRQKRSGWECPTTAMTGLCPTSGE